MPATSRNSDADPATDQTGLRFHLSQGVDQPEMRPTPNQVQATELSQGETENILKRLPPIKTDDNDEQAFALRERSLPPPRTGQTINVSFPQPTISSAPEKAATGPLEILRYAPEGEVPLAPQLSVTFSQPMIDVSYTEEAAANVPVKLSPQPPGRWHWVGTKTLLFEPAGRFPMATKYNVTVPVGTRSANGGTLAASKTWSFSTPPPVVKMTYPEKDSTQPRDALMFIGFDQRIDSAAVLQSIKVSAGKRVIKTRLATSDEVKTAISHNPEGTANFREAAKENWLAIRAVDPGGQTSAALPSNSRITVSIGPNIRSAEGPNPSSKPHEFSFRTYGPLRVTEYDCEEESRCRLFDSFDIDFSNELDAADFDDSKIKIEPAIGQMETSLYGSSLIIKGIKKGRTTYRVTLDASIKDEFGQTLGASTTVTFKVGATPKSFHGPGDDLVVIDPSGPPRCSVFSVNYRQLNIQIYSVVPADWPKWVSYQREEQSSDTKKQKTPPPGRLVFSQTLTLPAKPDQIVETSIDLTPAITNGFGQMILRVEPRGGTRSEGDDDGPDRAESWIQRTDIGLDAFVDKTDLVGWVTSLKDGLPLSEVDLALLPNDLTTKSGSDGLARLALKPQQGTPSQNLLVARKGSDVAILPEEVPYWNSSTGSWFRKDLSDSVRWYVFDDRKMYQPGEEVHVKGWIRRVGGSKTGDVGPLAGAATHVAFILSDSKGNQLKVGSMDVNVLGGFDSSFKLPATMNLGTASLKLQALTALTENTYAHEFQVQEFRRPEFEVGARNESEGPFFVGGSADLSVIAKYYSGGGLPNAAVNWHVTPVAGHFTPPNRGDYSFGAWVPWWQVDRNGPDDIDSARTLVGVTDAAGKHRLHIDFESVNPALPSSLTAFVNVTDVNRQRWASSTTLLVHPADLYVGLKSDRSFVQPGEPLVVQSIVADLEGRLIPGREIKMIAARLSWEQKKGEWIQVESNPEECSIQSAAGAAKCTFQPREGGEYRIKATIRDDRERRNESELRLWVAGGEPMAAPDLEEEEVELIPDRKEYKPGETAEVLVQAPFYPAEGLLTLQRSGILKSERFHMAGPSFTLRVPIEAAWTPNVFVQVDLLGAAERDSESVSQKADLKRPAFATGTRNLSIPPLDRRLSIVATPRDKGLEPGAETNVNVEVRDASGGPVSGSEVAVVVVDESVLALTNYKLDDPLSVFYSERVAGVDAFHLRERVMLSTSLAFGEEGGNAGGGGPSGLFSVYDAQSSGLLDRAPMQLRTMSGLILPSPPNMPPMPTPTPGEQIRIRQDFNALAVFAPSVPTDTNGRAEVKVKLPDNLTRYRVMAVAVAGGKQFGSGESSITARMPLMVRPSAPRFLNFGDRFELPIVVQNQTDERMSVDLAVRASNAVLSVPPAVSEGAGADLRAVVTTSSRPQEELTGRRVTVPANDRVEVRVHVATLTAGTTRFQIGAVSGRWSDAAEVSLPVWTPATTEAFAAYGEINQGTIAQPVKAPAEVFRQFGGLEIETSSTQLQQLTDAFLYLQNYPYECSEQLASRILSVAALRDVLTAFKAKELPPPQEIEAAVMRDLKRLQGMQNEDGGFGFWKRGDETWPYLSIHVAHALSRAKQKRFDVPAEILGKSQKYLRGIESRIPARYGPDARRALIAYALYVRTQMGDRDTTRARKLIAESGLEKLSLESVGWLLSVLSGDTGSQTQVAMVARLLSNLATETPATAHFVSSYKDDDYLLLHSNRRADAVILEALIADQPSNDLIPKIVRGLLDNRTQGRWANTQENVFILLALDRYFNTYEKVTPDFVARVWLGDAYAGEQQFKGRSVDRQQVNVPMRYLAERAVANNTAAQNLVVNKEGAGRLYYRLAMNYAPLNLNLRSAEDGFAVQRSYEAVDHADDVRRDADGTWHVKAGARVRVRLTMTTPSRRYHVALVDHLPAGFESLNPELAVTESIPEDKKQEPVVSYGSRSYGFGWWLWRPVWFDHQNLRDERSEAFTTLLWEGVYNYSYVARATTPGLFIVPPSKAEEMYHPETFGRSGTDRVRIQ